MTNVELIGRDTLCSGRHKKTRKNTIETIQQESKTNKKPTKPTSFDELSEGISSNFVQHIHIYMVNESVGHKVNHSVGVLMGKE